MFAFRRLIQSQNQIDNTGNTDIPQAVQHFMRVHLRICLTIPLLDAKLSCPQWIWIYL